MQKLFMILVGLVWIIGCSSENTNQEINKIENSSKDIQTQAPKAEQIDQKNPADVSSAKTENTDIVTAPPQEKLAKSTIILLFSVNDRVDPKEKDQILKAVKSKWLAEKQYVEVPENTTHTENDIKKFEEVINEYEGHVVFRVEVLYIYGEWEITVRVGRVEKIGEDFLEAPLDSWRKDHVGTAERLVKEIGYGKKLILEPDAKK